MTSTTFAILSADDARGGNFAAPRRDLGWGKRPIGANGGRQRTTDRIRKSRRTLLLPCSIVPMLHRPYEVPPAKVHNG